MELWIEIIFVLIGLHCIADYPLQGDFLAKMKGGFPIIMFAHCTIWTVVIYFGLWIYGFNKPEMLPFLFVTHWAIDKWKCNRMYKGNKKGLTTDLLIDQILHFITIAICIGYVC